MFDSLILNAVPGIRHELCQIRHQHFPTWFNQSEPRTALIVASETKLITTHLVMLHAFLSCSLDYIYYITYIKAKNLNNIKMNFTVASWLVFLVCLFRCFIEGVLNCVCRRAKYGCSYHVAPPKYGLIHCRVCRGRGGDSRVLCRHGKSPIMW